MILCEFTDGSSTTHFVGRKSAFESKSEFLNNCKGEFEWSFDRLGLEVIEGDVVDGVYCRYYPRLPGDLFYLDLESGYSFCDKKRGSFEVFVIDVRALQRRPKGINPTE